MQRRKDRLIGWYGILGSILLHLVGLLIVLAHRIEPLVVPETIEVTIEPALMPLSQKSQPNRQIVSPSDAPEKPPPLDTSRLSDRDTEAEVEQIRRGDSGGVPGPLNDSNAQKPSKESRQREPSLTRKEVPKKAEKPPKEIKQEKQQKQSDTPRNSEHSPQAPQHLTSLRLDESTLEEKFGVQEERKSQRVMESPQENHQQQKLSQYRAFSRPPGSGAAFFGSGGFSDHLPNLPDGDITLLNAKASQYAGFVRRVAVQVFGQLRSRGWENLSASEVRSINDFTTVEAILSKQGKLLGVRIAEGSGSSRFDEILSDSAKAGARDPNPPAGAEASDGNIHFIFKARSWSVMGANARNGAPFERRWILLATGLE